MNPSIISIQNRLQKELPEKRFQHTLGVAYTSVALGFSLGYDKIENLYLAGLLHDNAKCCEDNELLKISEENGFPVSEVERRNPSLLHDRVGAFFARTKYNITDEVILKAIENHTTGRPQMSLEEKIIFISDYLEPSRCFKSSPTLTELRQLMYKDLDMVVCYILQNTIDFLKENNKEIDAKSFATLEYYKNRRNEQ